ncbi:hypothetical protein ABEB36_014659 [Hypothenemus hampei]|uniref:Uncharacterized protein n=1 Tax=Hypothenemus hampei TaxID=57062 RepID=A0ABD1E2P4_HYPHA
MYNARYAYTNILVHALIRPLVLICVNTYTFYAKLCNTIFKQSTSSLDSGGLEIFEKNNKDETEIISVSFDFLRIIIILRKSANLKEKNYKDTLEERKIKIGNRIQQILSEIKTEEELTALANILSPIDATLMAIRNIIPEVKQTPYMKIPHNKKIDPQRQFFNTKIKKHKIKGILTKPTTKEVDEITLSLTLQENENLYC